jgi:hypothetical protein
MTWVLAGVAALGVAVLALRGWGAWRWQVATAELLAQLEAARQPIAPARFDAAELDALPAPVRRYFRAALRDGAPIVAAVTVEHRGTFNTGERDEQWKPFTSVQRVVTRRPGFVWDARVAIVPGLPVHVHDAYVAGTGILHPSIAGVFTLADLRGTRDVAFGELMRFFAEAAWYPTALLPSQGVRWQADDERSARATLADGDLELTLTFTFRADDGLIESVRADARGRTVGGRVEPTPWEGRWSDYVERDGMRVPSTGEVSWLLPARRQPYWRGTITALRYEFAP